MSRGSNETEKLRANVDAQLTRLLAQLKDLDELKAELDEEEYRSTRQETIAQLEHFETSLKNMMAGNLTLVSELGAIQLAIRGAIRGAFRTPEVMAAFAKRQPGQLRQRLAAVDSAAKLGKIPASAAVAQQVELLMALSKLGETLSPLEQAFLAANADQSTMDFQTVDSASLGQGVESTVLKVAGTAVAKSAKK
jgi:hypothetical protein